MWLKLSTILRRIKFTYISWFKDMPSALNRRVKVENKLSGFYARKESPTPEQCMEMAIELGVPDAVRIQKEKPR